MKSRFTLTLCFFIGLIVLAWFFSSAAPQASVESNELTVSFLDIGQGDSILLTTPHRQHILIDGGPDSTVLTRLGREMAFNERTIDLMITSHNHSDHITGLNEVMERYSVKAMWISGAIHTTNEYLQMLDNIRSHNVPTEVVWQGKTADIDGVHLEVLFPLESQEATRPDDQHDATVVVRATYGQKRFLFTGDLNEGHEQSIVDSGQDITADVLKEPHHGSATGLLAAFLDKVHPVYAVIQVGKKNKFGHPAAEILERLQAASVQIFRNDLDGTIRMTTDGSSLGIKRQQ